ncbi:MAG: sigma-54-dependent transcriptional regulator [Bacteroidota bacterium]
MKKILVIDDDSYICNLLTDYLKQKGFEAEGSLSGINGIKLFDRNSFDMVLCDYRLPDSDGYELLKHFKSSKPSVPVIIMTAYADVRMAVKLIKSGAFDYVTKPVQPEEILQLLQKAFSEQKVHKSVSSFNENFIAGKSSAIKEVLNHVELVAPTELTVLIEGETGSGKEYIARAIHYTSKRKNKPFVAVDCGAMPKDLANSELFGHVKGAFTGAINDKQGHFLEAEGGTIFLDEVGNLPYENQSKLLRALQERVISKVGENKIINVDVRVIVATNESLIKLVGENEFREDLYHRLNEFKINLPPLRERSEDIMEFVEAFIQRANKQFGKSVTGLDNEVKRLLTEYPWYGNIRELQNVINRAVLLTGTDKIQPGALPEEMRYKSTQVEEDNLSHKIHKTEHLKEATELTEKEVIYNALIKVNFNKSKAAKLLNIDRKTLYNKIKLYKLESMK